MEITSYCYILTHIILILTCTQMFYLAKATTNLATDQSALLALKANIALDPRHILARNWTNSSSVCSWIGVTCSLRHHRVSALNISKMGLSATIPPFLANLSFLVSLDLSYNHFNGTVPNELSLLHRLKFISLRNNSFSGFIPTSLSNLSNLQFLQLSYNDLQGNIPEELGRLGRLQSLIIENNHLSGAIPSAIFNISTLKRIGFTTNELSGSLPSEMCSNLPLLEGLHLSDNQLSGQIPSYISQCSQLRILSLAYNSFSGQIPAEIGKLVWLQELYLGYNNLNGVLPKEIGNLTKIKSLNLGDNNFTGILPKEIGQLYQLEVLQFEVNNFVGLIPSEIFNISTLLALSLIENGLSGTLPTNLCYGLPILEQLVLSGNYLSGAIPNSISNCSKLRRLGLAENNFTGFVPHFFENLRLLELVQLFSNNLRMKSSSSELSFITSLTNCPSLQVFAINDNPLHGVIPVSIGNLSSSLEQFFAYNCNIKGSIPANIGNLSNLVILSLHKNELSGNIPHTVKHLHKLQALSLYDNNLRGPIPKGLCDLHSLSILGLGQNQLAGPIPECLGNVSSLRMIDLSSNMLTSSIPLSLWRLKDLLLLNLFNNSLSGILSPEIGNLLAATEIDLSRNQLSESIPATIGNLKNLIYLSFAHNRLEGIIPVSVGSMLSLETLNFSYNNLSGSIPKSIENLQHLVNFNVSFNALSGEIPIGGPFKNFTPESFKANKALCGIQRFHVPLCHTASNRKSRKENVKFALFILAGVIALIIVISLVFIFIRYRKRDKTVKIDEQVFIVSERISYYEILQATEQFNESNLIGSGSFGSVYRGILRDGRVIAVKVFKLQNEVAFRSFDIECEVLRNIRHRNLTKVLSSCSNEDFRALILEYMSNGNLEKWLYSHNYCLDMMQRLNIMIDVASALEYLHHDYSTPIVHCDLKPSNVLLDEEMIGHVCDFGIARLLANEESMTITNTLATFGYIAPEYGLEGKVSRRCDVYSYGVMLMETFTRKRPSDDMFFGDLSLKSWVQNSLPQSSHEIIDANLFINLDQQHSCKIVQCVSSILELALKCCAESPSDRINMKEAVTQLLKIKSQCSQAVLNYKG